ncbi:maltose transporter permease [Nocardia brasiliensis]|nr:maltose transporter permease [Nocardia brasiliensis]
MLPCRVGHSLVGPTVEEAAILDGCTPWQVYRRVLLPHTRPALMVLTWITVWNDFRWPPVMIQRQTARTPRSPGRSRQLGQQGYSPQ